MAFSTIPFHLRRSWTCSVHFMSFIFFKSFLTSSSHRDLSLPTGLSVNGFHLCIQELSNEITFFFPQIVPSESIDGNAIFTHFTQTKWWYFFNISLTVHFGIILINNQLDAVFQCIYLFHFSTCFEQPSAHHQESQLYQYIIWYLSLCVGDCLVCRSGSSFPTGIPGSHMYQMMYWYSWLSWWWALGCSKHVEKRNK